MIQQFETHPNRDSLTEYLNKTVEFSPFSDKSKELITSMGKTEHFEMCEISFKIQCPDCTSSWEVGIVLLRLRQMSAAVGKKLIVEQG